MLNADYTTPHLEQLMEVASALGALTQKSEDFRSLARYLSTAFQFPDVTVAVVKTVADGAMVLLSGTSTEPSPALEQEILDLHQQTRAITLQDGPLVRANDLIFAHAIDEYDRLLVILRRPSGEPSIAQEVTSVLQLICLQLGRNLQALLMWNLHPQVIGKPFDRLTDREWIVLRSMNSDVSEKQLADQLGLSPHTLHSHIKSIYRKVGVQGRLALIRKVEEGLREFRMSRGLAFLPANGKQIAALAN